MSNTNTSTEMIERFSRQMILDGFHLEGQMALREIKVLIVGCGGLGCPLGLYLAAAGVGKIGLLDGDIVESSNLHRQVAHRNSTVGVEKVTSLALSCKDVGWEGIEVVEHHTYLRKDNAISIIKDYDIVADCMDNVYSRYLLNDAVYHASLGKKERICLVSAAAIGLRGQLMTLMLGDDGSCLRCIQKEAPPAHLVGSCDQAGVLGPVTGIMGTMQALEVIKCALHLSGIEGEGCWKPSFKNRMTSFDNGNFRNLKLRNRDPKCSLCSKEQMLTLTDDYFSFCGGAPAHQGLSKEGGKDEIVYEGDRITTEEWELMDKGNVVLLDCRPRAHQAIFKLKETTLSIPMDELEKKGYLVRDEMERDNKAGNKELVVVCRRGNNSRLALMLLFKEFGIKGRDVIGGIHALSKYRKMTCPEKVEESIPIY